MYRVLFFLAAASCLVEAKHLPTYIKACKKGPGLNECGKKHAILAIPSILKGDKSFKSPPLSPLHLDLIDLQASTTLNLKLSNITLRGLESGDLKDLQLDLDKQHIIAKILFKFINIQSEYSLNGRLLVLPIKGQGPANITFDNVDVNVGIDYKLIKKNDGKEYMDKSIKPTVKYTIGGAHYHFDNLFSGDNLLGNHINEFLNEHSAEISKDVGHSVSETIGAVVTNILGLYLPNIPYDEIFLD